MGGLEDGGVGTSGGEGKEEMERGGCGGYGSLRKRGGVLVWVLLEHPEEREKEEMGREGCGGCGSPQRRGAGSYGSLRRRGEGGDGKGRTWGMWEPPKVRGKEETGRGRHWEFGSLRRRGGVVRWEPTEKRGKGETRRGGPKERVCEIPEKGGVGASGGDREGRTRGEGETRKEMGEGGLRHSGSE